MSNTLHMNNRAMPRRIVIASLSPPGLVGHCFDSAIFVLLIDVILIRGRSSPSYNYFYF